MTPLTDALSDSDGFSLLARALPDAVLALNASGRVAYADARARAVFGGAVVGRQFHDLIDPGDAHVLTDGEGRLTAGVWDLRAAGGDPWLSVAFHALDPEDTPWEDVAGGVVALVRPVPEGGTRDRTDLFRRAFDAANNLIVVTDARVPGNPIVLANEYFLDATGYAREEVVGRNCRFLQQRPDGTRDDDQPALDDLRAAIAAGEPTRVVLRNYRKSGELFYNELFISPVHDATGQLVHFVGVQNDVTDRVRAEAAEAERAEAVGAFFDAMPLPMGALEATDDGLVHRAANRSAAALFGGDPVGREIGALGVPPAARERWAAAVAEAGAEGAATFEARYPWEAAEDEGRVLRYTVSPASGGLFAYVGKDVTEARRVARERRLLAAAVRSAAEAIVVTDADLDDGPHILYANAAHSAIFGYRAEEIVGNTPRLYQGPRTERAVLDRVRAGLEAGETVRAETINYRKDGTPFLLEWEIAPVHGPDGRVVNFVGTQRDVTERRRLEREVLDVSAHERERMARDLHDGLGQVLTGASLQVQALANELDAAGEGADLAAFAEQARAARALVDRALSDARATARGLLPAVADRNGLTTALGRLAVDVGQAYGVACSFRAPEPVGARTVEAAGHLLRIAQEAVANAARHGRATTIEIALTAAGGWATLAVTDDGAGVSPEAVAGEGGLGMTTMRYRAERVGGAFAIAPGAEGGTRVTVTFPVEPG